MSAPVALGFAVIVLAAAQGLDGGSSQPPREDSEPARAATAQRVRITVRVIAATEDSSEERDPRLAPIAHSLSEFAKDFRFRHYRLIDEQDFELALQSAAQMELPGSRSLQVTPRKLSADGRIRVHLELLGEHPAHLRKLHTDYTIQREGTIFVGGLKLDPQNPGAGMLLIAITQAMTK